VDLGEIATIDGGIVARPASDQQQSVPIARQCRDLGTPGQQADEGPVQGSRLLGYFSRHLSERGLIGPLGTRIGLV
jgi:hypothetical protein